MDFLTPYKDSFLNFIRANKFARNPENLYKPVDYILSLDGKRIRPLLCLMGCDAVSKDGFDNALESAMAVEVFHNFTLLHDDIMDEAPLRRGQLTVHEKYNINTAILSGDVMMIYAFKYLENYPPELALKLLKVFNKMAVEVCEGQQMDMDFENRNHVGILEYVEMITLKTSVLIGAAIQMGALIGGASDETAKHLYQFGKNIGISFQMQDDILDTFGEPKVGKQPGGDIIQNKKTYLYIKTLELCSASEKEEMLSLYSTKPEDPTEKVERVREIMKNNHVLVHSNEMQNEYKSLAFSHLDAAFLGDHAKAKFQEFGEFLLNRST